MQKIEKNNDKAKKARGESDPYLALDVDKKDVNNKASSRGAKR